MTDPDLDQVRDLLSQAFAGEPPLGLDRTTAVAAGRRARRRRRLSYTGAVGLCLAAVVGATVAVPAAFGGDGDDAQRLRYAQGAPSTSGAGRPAWQREPGSHCLPPGDNQHPDKGRLIYRDLPALAALRPAAETGLRASLPGVAHRYVAGAEAKPGDRKGRYISFAYDLATTPVATTVFVEYRTEGHTPAIQADFEYQRRWYENCTPMQRRSVPGVGEAVLYPQGLGGPDASIWATLHIDGVKIAVSVISQEGLSESDPTRLSVTAEQALRIAVAVAAVR